MRTHLSRHPATLQVVEVEQPVRAYDKPLGFWWEVDGDWRRWCAEESYITHGYLFAVDLGRTEVLRVCDASGLDSFAEAYRDPVSNWIEWHRVARDWDGVEIAPYLRERRMAGHASWYYTWDCASGVVWRPRGVALEYLGPWWAEAEQMEGTR